MSMVVVLDTNVLISAIVFGGKPRLILEMVIRGEIDLILSDPILQEVQGVLSGKKFHYPVQVVVEIAHQLASLATIVYPQQEIKVIKNDPPDNRILECAAAGKVRYIVSGDEDLLSLQSYERIKIITPDEFLRLRGSDS
jgi:putative PIN family toxin of toxin-antitoxin system